MTDHVLKFWKFALGIPESQEFKFKGTPVTPKFSATSTSDTGWACKRFWYARTCSRSFIALSSLVGLGLSTLPGEPKMCCVFVRHGKVWENDFAQEVLEFRSVLMSFDRGRFVVVHPCSSLSLRRWVAKMPKLKMVSNLGFLPLKGDRISWSLRSFAHKCLLHCAKFGPGLVKAKVGVQIRVEVKVLTFTSTRRSWSGLESGSVTESGVGVLIWVCIRFQVGVWIRICVWFRVKVPVRVWIWVRSLGLDLTPSLIRIQFFQSLGTDLNLARMQTRTRTLSRIWTWTRGLDLSPDLISGQWPGPCLRQVQHLDPVKVCSRSRSRSESRSGSVSMNYEGSYFPR